MVYKWKLNGLYKVEAQKAGNELERIGKIHGAITPEAIVDESRKKTAVLHNCFDWNDETAANSYRQMQAREIVRNIVTVSVDGEQTNEPVRAFVSIQNEYKPIDVVIKTAEYCDELFSKAMSELKNFKNKYSNLEKLSDLFRHIEQLIESA